MATIIGTTPLAKFILGAIILILGPAYSRLSPKARYSSPLYASCGRRKQRDTWRYCLPTGLRVPPLYHDESGINIREKASADRKTNENIQANCHVRAGCEGVQIPDWNLKRTHQDMNTYQDMLLLPAKASFLDSECDKFMDPKTKNLKHVGPRFDLQRTKSIIFGRYQLVDSPMFSPEMLTLLLSERGEADCMKEEFEYEKGRISRQTCYDCLGHELSLIPADIRMANEELHASLRCNTNLLGFLRELKDVKQGALRIFAMSNISQPDYEALRRISSDMDWDGLVYRDFTEVKRALFNLLGDSILRGKIFLKENRGRLTSICSGVIMQENLSQLLMLEMTNDRQVELAIIQWADDIQWGGQCATADYPCDINTTSLFPTVIWEKVEVAASVTDEMLKFVNDDGIIQIYFDPKRPRINPIVCVNVLSLFYSYSRGNETNQTLEWVHQVLFHRAYGQGSRYYETAERFLFFLYRFISGCDDQVVRSRFYPLLKDRIPERIGVESDGLALAVYKMRSTFRLLEFSNAMSADEMPV
ncbi:hypothetical protein DFS33DRAFT_1276282 [Desarmillaria ectypa]|nr:hypothetical protein DFS33DRAFT_1276282 [Desarmillaria ectypa]